jgi:hypothetical protein
MIEGSKASDLAEERIAAREGAPDGGAPAPSKRGGARPGAGRKKTGKKTGAAKPAAEEEPITEAEIAMFATLGGVLWGLSAKLFDMEGLTEKEAHDLGAAMAPVARKYIPSLDEYAPEATLIIMVGGLIVSKRRKTKPAPMELVPEAPESPFDPLPPMGTGATN